jgi:hypothetical protein
VRSHGCFQGCDSSYEDRRERAGRNSVGARNAPGTSSRVEGTALEFSTTTEFCQGPVFEIISSQRDPAALYSTLNSNIDNCTEDTKFLVTIDPIDSECWDSDGTDLESSIVLYNFGIAHSCLTSISGCRFTNATNQENSYRILQLTHTHAFQLLHKALHKSHLCTQIMLINLLLTVSLVNISSRNYPITSAAYCGSLEELMLVINAHQKLLPVADCKFAAAA